MNTLTPVKWANLLHFYQPYNQQKDILDRIVHECYIPVLKGFCARPSAKAVFNINGSLTRLLSENGYGEVLDMFKLLLDRGQIEFTGSAMYHALLPLLPRDEIKRQIELNTKINRELLGDNFRPVGFFSPEMAISDTLLSVVHELGFTWVSASDVAYEDKSMQDRGHFTDDKTGLSVIFRNKRISSLVLSGVIHDPDTMVKETSDIYSGKHYWFSVMDAETFGHHRIGHDKFLFDLVDSSKFEFVTGTDLLALPLPATKVSLRECTWTNDEQDFWLSKEKKSVNSFILWQDPTNPIHKLQWEFLNYVIDLVSKYPDKSAGSWVTSRDLLDKGMASDQFWWASAKPWWSLEMIELGAYELKNVVFALYPATATQATTAETYYRQILDKAFEWQRTGYIRQQHVHNSDTYMKAPLRERAPAEWFNQLMLEFADAMQKSADVQDYEKAIKWRDALLKIKNGTDIYDIFHVVNDLWTARNIPALKPFLTYKWTEIPEFIKPYFLNVSNEAEFEAWKKNKQSGILN